MRCGLDGPGTHLLSTLEVASWRVFKSGSHHFLSFPLVLACCLELNPLAHSGRPLFNHHLGILYQSHQWPRRGEEIVSNVRSNLTTATDISLFCVWCRPFISTHHSSSSVSVWHVKIRSERPPTQSVGRWVHAVQINFIN